MTEARKFLVRLPVDSHNALKGAAFFSERSMNELVCEAVAEYLTLHRPDHVRAVSDRMQADYGPLFEKLADL